MASDLDVEALLDSVATKTDTEPREDSTKHKADRRRDDRDRDTKRRERSRDRRRDDRDRDDSVKSPRRSRSRDRHDRRGRYPDDRDERRGSGGDYYRGSASRRSRSPDPDRHWRPGRRERDDRDEVRDRDREKGRREGRAKDSRRSRTVTPPANEDERDRRTVFVQQLAARLRTKELFNFFNEKAGPVQEAQIVKDRVSGRSKGVGYVEFKHESSVPLAIQLTGQKLLGIPIIAQHTEAEKNRAARNTEGGSSAANGVPFHRLYVGNIHFSITEHDLQNVFEPFGELEFVQLQKEEAGRSRGYGFVQFRDPDSAKEALEKMNGFELAGRPIRVGLGNDKFTPESTAIAAQKFGQGNGQPFQGSAFSGHGGRGAQAGGSGGSFDRIGGRDDKGAGGASALDDSDVAGVNFNNYSRDALMRKLARTEEPVETNGPASRQAAVKPRTETKSLPVNVSQASRCVVLKNCFDPAKETGDSWVKELEDEVREECERQYGHVVHIAVEPNSAGEIYVKFDKLSSGEKAILGLNGRYFGGFQITAQPVVDAVYSSLFARTSAI